MTQLTQHDILAGDQLSATAYRRAGETFQQQNRPGAVMPIPGGFANMVQLGEQLIGIGSDGIGTKVDVAERMGQFDTIGFDLMAMIADDLIANGFDPRFLSNVLDINRADQKIISSLMTGLRDAALYTGVAITGGEIADLGERIGGYGDFHFNWSGTGMGPLLSELKEPITGKDVEPGDIVVAIAETGPRCNGFTRMRHILNECYGDQWHLTPFIDTTWGEWLLQPATIYTPLIREMIRSGLIPKGIAHITGGGVVENLRRITNGYGASLDLFPVPEPFRWLINQGDLSLKEGYHLWHMGQGMLLIFSPEMIGTNLLTPYGKKVKISGKIIKSSEMQIGGV